MQPQVQINIEYIINNFSSGADFKTDKDRLILQSTHNSINNNKEQSRNCCSCRQRMFSYIKQYYNGQKKENN
jgi:hypothetical protein